VTSAGPDTLLERGAELTELRALLAAARAAAGSVALIEAPAGQGKTALLRALKREAGDARVLSATGAPLERDFAFGIVRQLFAAQAHRPELFSGAAKHAEPVFDLTLDEAEDPAHATLYGLYWLAANLAAEQPLVLVVDDAQWADAPSLRFLDGLARRVEDLPLLLAIAARPGERALLDGLAAAPAATLIRPQPLSDAGVERFVKASLAAAPEFVAACRETTRGNPLLLTELLRAASRGCSGASISGSASAGNGVPARANSLTTSRPASSRPSNASDTSPPSNSWGVSCAAKSRCSVPAVGLFISPARSSSPRGIR
jgi:predicted ATPase